MFKYVSRGTPCSLLHVDLPALPSNAKVEDHVELSESAELRYSEIENCPLAMSNISEMLLDPC